MNSTIYKATDRKGDKNEAIILQVTKNQLINFFRFSLLAAVLVVNFLAIAFNSPLLVELIMAQIIIGLVLLTRDLNSHSTLN